VAGVVTLTPRERQVVDLIGEGRRAKQVAAALGISTNTVRVHLRNIDRLLQPLYPLYPRHTRIVVFYRDRLLKLG
jgi:DNA-binding NarL/FixJ family response regulator